ncbi:MAG: acyl-CoA thioesterase [Polyangiaceae bacterium]
MRTPAEARSAYRRFCPIPTRWMDNDIYGHVNNVVYYSYFDTAINRYLIDEAGLDIAGGAIIGLCVESHCAYLRPIAFPAELDAGMRVAHIGTSSVRYELGLFARGSEEAAAHGWFVHVFVDRATRRPIILADRMRGALERIKVAP